MPSPSRWDKKPIASDTLRLQWAQLAVDHELACGHSKLKVSDFELKLGEFRGTYRLLSELRNLHNASRQFKLICGQDSLNSMNTWRDAKTKTLNGLKILEEFSLLVVPRGAKPMTIQRPEWATPFAKKIESLPTFSEYEQQLADLGSAHDLAELSSSKIKELMSQNKVTGRYSIETIENQIRQLGLYKK